MEILFESNSKNLGSIVKIDFCGLSVESHHAGEMCFIFQLMFVAKKKQEELDMVELVEYSSSKATIGSEVFLPSERSSLFQSPSTKIGSTWYPILKKDSVIV